MNVYKITGLTLTVIGFIIAPYSYLIIESMPLTAVGFSTLILGFTGLGISGARPGVSTEAFLISRRTGVENVTALLKGFGIREKAVYLPRNMSNGRSKALVPLPEKDNSEYWKELLSGQELVRYMPGSGVPALAVTTTGNASLDLIANKPGGTAKEIKSALNQVLRSLMGNVSATKVDLSDTRVQVNLNGAQTGKEKGLFYDCFGSSPASIAASICSEALNKAVRITGEEHQGTSCKITLEIVQ